jgi:hypothetical protein
LKAYADHSKYVERELQRFRDYEKALEQGAVIEKLEDADDRQRLASSEFEPKLHLGTNAVDELYSPLLGGLLELRRLHKQRAWGLPSDARSDRDLAPTITKLSAQGIPAGERDCLIEIDEHYSSFRFEKFVDGQRRTLKMTYVPSLEDLKRDLEKAEEGQRIERRRRAGISTNGGGVILLNRPREAEGRREIGKPFDSGDRERPPDGAGVNSNASTHSLSANSTARVAVAASASLRHENLLDRGKVSLSARRTGGEGRGELGPERTVAVVGPLSVLIPLSPLTGALCPLGGEENSDVAMSLRKTFLDGAVFIFSLESERCLPGRSEPG